VRDVCLAGSSFRVRTVIRSLSAVRPGSVELYNLNLLSVSSPIETRIDAFVGSRDMRLHVTIHSFLL